MKCLLLLTFGNVSTIWVFIFVQQCIDLPLLFGTVVSQVYDTDVNKEYVIRGNAAVLKCQVPSFVADFVTVVSWHTDQAEDFYPSTQFGKF